jgi:hypothetical protein
MNISKPEKNPKLTTIIILLPYTVFAFRRQPESPTGATLRNCRDGSEGKGEK